MRTWQVRVYSFSCGTSDAMQDSTSYLESTSHKSDVFWDKEIPRTFQEHELRVLQEIS